MPALKPVFTLDEVIEHIKAETRMQDHRDGLLTIGGERMLVEEVERLRGEVAILRGALDHSYAVLDSKQAYANRLEGALAGVPRTPHGDGQGETLHMQAPLQSGGSQ